MKIVEYYALKKIKPMVLDGTDLVTCVKTYRKLILDMTGEDVGIYKAHRFCAELLEDIDESTRLSDN